MPDLIIFDCDGTLVDSEFLYNSITAELLNELGFPEYTTEKCISLFAGQSWNMIEAMLRDRHGAEVTGDLVAQYAEIANARMEENLNASTGAHGVLENLQKSHDICIASNGEYSNIIKSLELTGLIQFFPVEQIFSKNQVENPKPAPDLFLFTVNEMGFAPAQCLVIEDSVAGVQAGVAAQMKVIGFTGCAHDQARQAKMLRDAGADIVIDQLIHIADHI